MINRQRGFITIATGKEEYYIVARNLLRSYRACVQNPLPFAIMSDRENEYTSEFDDVIVLGDKATNSYLDKLFLSDYLPYNETVFIDADSLCLSDPGKVFDDFTDCGDVSYYGCVLLKDSKYGWFDYQSCKEYKDIIEFNLDGHGGLYYFRKNDNSKEIMSLAVDLLKDYESYGFKYFDKPADEPVISLAMAVNGSLPCVKDPRIIFVAGTRRIKVDYNGNIRVNNQIINVNILHFAMVNTRQFMYVWLEELISNQYYSDNPKLRKKRYRELRKKMLPKSIKKWAWHNGGRLLRLVIPGTIVQKWKSTIKNR